MAGGRAAIDEKRHGETHAFLHSQDRGRAWFGSRSDRGSRLSIDLSQCVQPLPDDAGNRLTGSALQQLRQLGDVGGDASGLVAGQQLRRRAPSRLILEIDVGEFCPFWITQ
jgi:hypothetical protein